MKEYQKIETVFARDIDGTKKLIEGKYRSPIVEYLKDNQWIFTEKIDGTNIRVLWNGHNFEFYGRTDKAQIPADLVNKLQSIFCNDEMEQMFEQLFEDTEVIVIGEGYGRKIQKVGSAYNPDGVDFIVFDIIINDMYLSRYNVEDICGKLGLDIVPVIHTGSIQSAVDIVKSGLHSVIGNCEAEGLVGVPVVPVYDKMGNRIIVKIKGKDFKEIV
jgi:hypothetical protein